MRPLIRRTEVRRTEASRTIALSIARSPRKDRFAFLDRFQNDDVLDRCRFHLERILLEDHQVGKLARF